MLSKRSALSLNRETLRTLSNAEMTAIVGGGIMVSATIYLPNYSEYCVTKKCDITRGCDPSTETHGSATRR